MRNILGAFLAISGAIVLTFAILQYVEYQAGTKKALAEANALIDPSNKQYNPGHDHVVPPNEMAHRESSETLPDPHVGRRTFRPELDDVIGILEIPKLKAELPMIEGADEEMLKKGVGHYSSSAFPLDDEQILLSGHRDTVFRNFDKLELGDRFIVKLPYGTFEYEIKSTDIVDKDDTTVIRSMGTEALVVTTCYPFRYVGSAPERYILYAYPVKDEKKSLLERVTSSLND
ncbi:class D sortase [Cohnella sp. REN36]|uniref:class D sortase n=1 Tax=Cohnella sp. REN36 TaxID=2887347 RepID=UPI001D157BCF|nr:class D sortase [Cohnella sp. REN36]MCC3376307.1 class D sortase [Cohnella sp. REN36]